MEVGGYFRRPTRPGRRLLFELFRFTHAVTTIPAAQDVAWRGDDDERLVT